MVPRIICLSVLLFGQTLWLESLPTPPATVPEISDATAAIETRFPYPIDFVSFTSQQEQFSVGDAIIVTSLRGDRRHIEPNGRYLIEGEFTLHSMDRATLGLYAPDPRRALIEVGDEKRVSRGTGHFELAITLPIVGPFPVFLFPITGGKTHGVVFVSEVAQPPSADKDDTTILIGINNDRQITAKNKFVTGEELDLLLTEAHHKDPETAALLKTYDAVGMDQVKFVMDTCRDAGITNIGLECMTVISLDRSDLVSLDHRTILDAQLKPLLKRIENMDVNAPVVIEYYNNTPPKKLAFVVHACRDAGLVNLILQCR